jgi:hypothetical protein
MSLTKVTYSMIEGSVVNVIDFGADPTGATDSTVAIQAAIDSVTNGTVYFPNGTYSINTTLNIDASVKRSLNLLGNGLASSLQYDGAVDAIPMVYYFGGGNSAFVNIENLQFINNHRTGDTTLNNVIGVRIGKKDATAISGINGTCNVTFTKNQFQYCDTPIEIYSESDQITIQDNYFFVWTGYAVLGTINPLVVSGSGNAAVRIINNLFMGGQTGSWCIRTNGSASTITGNVIQNATSGRGIELTNGPGFNISCNYTESTGIGPFIFCDTVSNGYIGENEIGGYPGGFIIDIGANCDNVNIGSNLFAVSGGVALAHVRIDAASTGVNLLGKQQATSGSSNLITGTPSFSFDGDGNTTASASCKAPLITTASSIVNVLASSSSTLFTAVANACYLVNVTQEPEDYAATAVVTVLGNSSAVVVTSLYSTNANLSITATGLDVKVNNGIANTRTIYYGFIRIA